MKHPPLTAISESVGDVLSTGTGIVHDLGSTAAEKLPELPDTVNRLAQRAQRRFRPKKKKRLRVTPVLIVAAALAAFIAVMAWRRRASTATELTQHAPPREYTEQATAAAAGR
jgi:hypothetical protein